MKYCESVFQTKRWKTREVLVGSVGVGGDNPIRIQSMTTSSTRNVEETVDQIIRLADCGCELARVTVQGIKEADACEGIKNGLIQRGYTIPLIADIHFYPPAAMRVADFVDKVRINPGNFVDKRATFKIIDYDDNSYAEEIEKIEEKFTPLVEKCKKLKRAMRIGTNHGSLSDRIMNRYGDTPKGMVESAIEFAEVCRKNDYHEIIFSMKASNPLVMIEAYRLLVAEMIERGWDYPLHLGVTEAGEGEDGRVKSAMGIGALLLDGIGDTIRISLTEDPWFEIDPCKRLLQFTQNQMGKGIAPFVESHRKISEIKKREVHFPKGLSLHKDGSVLLSITSEQVASSDFYKKIGCDTLSGEPKIKKSSGDLLVMRETPREPLKKIDDLNTLGISTLFSIENHPSIVNITEDTPSSWASLLSTPPSLIILSPKASRLHLCRKFFDWLQTHHVQVPVILHFTYDCTQEDFLLQAAAECGALLCDRLGEGLWLEGPYELSFLRTLTFTILQSARMRTFKTDFISCPSCGRTLFNLQEVTKQIHARTSHLPGVKIAIMGCIVNGPGEMADADFGYVGSKPGKIDFYIGKKCVQKDIDSKDAVEFLVELIKKEGRWVEPEEAQVCLI